MATYQYEYSNTEGWSAQYIQGKIYANFGFQPANPGWFEGVGLAIGMGDDGLGGIVSVYTSVDLDTSVKDSLDTFMNTVSGLAPTTSGYTLIKIPNFMYDWHSIESGSDVDISFVFVNKQTHDIELWVLGNINTTNRNKLLGVLKDKIVIQKY